MSLVFFNLISLDKHEQSLSKVLTKCNSEEGSDRKTNSIESDMTIALAEHLLCRLAPGKSYVIDNRAQRKKEEKCKCGLEHCIGKPVFESTGIGMLILKFYCYSNDFHSYAPFEKKLIL